MNRRCVLHGGPEEGEVLYFAELPRSITLPVRGSFGTRFARYEPVGELAAHGDAFAYECVEPAC